jgi:hypothetical protein
MSMILLEPASKSSHLNAGKPADHLINGVFSKNANCASEWLLYRPEANCPRDVRTLSELPGDENE